MFKFYTAGESHGHVLIAFLEGIPAGLEIKEEEINYELARRQKGYGRGERMGIEEDKVEILTGLRKNKTIGSPLVLLIKNKDFKIVPPITKPRPGHADLCGVLKFGFRDVADVLERASARETAARVAAGAVCKKLLSEFKIKIYSRTYQIGSIKDDQKFVISSSTIKKIESSPLRCLSKEIEKKMINLINKAKDKGDTLGGISEIIIQGVPYGLGSYIQWDKRINACFAYVLMSIPSVKAVEVGAGFKSGEMFGSQFQDEIFYDNKKFYRKTNNAGGIEGGITNGENIILRVVFKPISTLKKPLRSVDILTKEKVEATIERSDICIVPAGGVVAEAMIAIELVRQMKEKFGGDSLEEIKKNYYNFLNKRK